MLIRSRLSYVASARPLLQKCRLRQYSSNAVSQRQPKVAVIGSGPSAIYTSLKLLESSNMDVQVDMFEKKPFPYGLIRFGVAPDHPEFNYCNGRLEDAYAMGNEKFRFYGNVEIGKDISIRELLDNYNAVLFAYGTASARHLGIEGETLPGVIDSKAFVGWYNGDPEYKSLDPPLQKVKTVSIIGNGNVSMDIIRVLLASPENHWAKTDISEYAYEKLKQSKVTKVNVHARRGFFESAFTNKELKECIQLQDQGVFCTGFDENSLKPVVREMSHLFGRVAKRRLSLLDECKKPEYLKQLSNHPHPKTFEFRYLETPKKFTANENDPELLKSVTFTKNLITFETPESPPGIKATNEEIEYPTDLVITSVGYKSEPINGMADCGIKFDERKSVIVNEGGVVKLQDGNPSNALVYTTGWVANGGKGAINASVMTSQNLASIMMNDLKDQGEKSGRSEIEKLVEARGIDMMGWEDYKILEKYEIQKAKELGKDGYKVTDYNEIIDIIHKGRKN